MIKFQKAKDNFFDRAIVIRAVDKASHRILNQAGRKIRAYAQKSLVYRETTSSPGSPPHAHKTGTVNRKSRSTGKIRARRVSYLREFLFYSFDGATKSVVVGPAKLNSTVDPDSLSALEYGGTSRRLEGDKKVRITIRARPFMGPAFEAERPELLAMWKDSVK